MTSFPEIEYTRRMNRTEIAPASPAPAGTWFSQVSALHEQKRGLAKLLATENISVVHEDGVDPSFDVKERILRLPKWESITLAQYDLLIGHEVGHAKFTPYDDTLRAEYQEKPGFHDFMNILEDNRIERLMQAEFPGLRPAFRQGYADFFAHGPCLQSESLKPAAEYSLIDRLNLDAKIGAHLDVPFTEEEDAYRTRANQTRTFTDVLTLARELYDRARQQQQEQKKQQQQQSQQNASNTLPPSESTESSESDQTDPSQSTEPSATTNPAQDAQDTPQDAPGTANAKPGDQTPQTTDASESESQDEPLSVTASQITEQLRTTVGTTDRNSKTQQPISVTLGRWSVKDLTASGSIVPLADIYRQHLATNAGVAPDTVSRILTNRSDAFNRQHAATIRALVNEFTRKQSASRHHRSKIATTGRLNLNTLHAYKFREDLFQQVRKLPNGKKHGILVLVDGSGSMESFFADVLQHALVLAEFAHRVHIPCKVAIFGCREFSLRDVNVEPKALTSAVATIAPSASSQLKEIIDTTARIPFRDQRSMVVRMILSAEARILTRGKVLDWLQTTATAAGATVTGLRDYLSLTPAARLADTPLLSALVCADAWIHEWSGRVEKTTLTLLTDGQDNVGLSVVHPTGAWDATRSVSNAPLVITDRLTGHLYPAWKPTQVTDYAQPPMKVTENGVEYTRYPSYESCGGSRQLVQTALLQSLSRRYATRLLNICLVSSTGRVERIHREVSSALKAVAPYKPETRINGMLQTESVPQSTLDTVASALKTDGVYEVPKHLQTRFDRAVLVGSQYVRLEDTDFQSKDTSTFTPARVIREFQKTLTRTAANRRLVQSMIPAIA